MMNIRYKRMESQHLDAVVKLYIDYYNTYEGGCWTYDKAYKRLHQLMTIEDALCFIQMADHAISGFVMGYFKEFDDLTVLLSVNDEMHSYFYTKNGYRNAENMIFKCKHFTQ